MAIADIVLYETTFPLKLTHPVTCEEIGVIFNIRSDASEAVKRIRRQQQDGNIARITQGGKLKTIELDKQEIERLAASVESWDWGGQEYKEGEGAPIHSQQEVELILSETEWIKLQVRAGVEKIENFTRK